MAHCKCSPVAMLHLVLAMSSLAAVKSDGYELCGGACTSGMVFDRNNASIWAVNAPPDSWFSVSVHQHGLLTGAPLSTRSGVDGAWQATLGPQKPGINYTVTVTCTTGGGVTLEDVAFGDVFLCSGQSNMELPLSFVINGSAILSESDTLGRDIRVMRVDHFSAPNSTTQQLVWGNDWTGNPGCTDRCGAPWARMSGKAWRDFSAICYLSGRGVYLGLNKSVPVGLVEAAWGGTRIESWSSAEALTVCSGTETAKCGPCLNNADTGSACSRMNSSNSGNLCSCNYNGMLYPLRRMRFKAMLWYQGESNTDAFQGTVAGPANYACRINAAISDWRSLFMNQYLPIFNVELAACNNYPSAAANAMVWPYMRQASRAFLGHVGTTGFVTAIDVGIANGGVHSNEKQPVGHRMAQQLLKHLYNADVVAGGPTLAARPPLNVSSNEVTLTFRDATTGLHMATPKAYNTTGSKVGCSESPFEVGWLDGGWTRTVYIVSDESVILSLPRNRSRIPTEIRYAWHGFPQCVLYSGIEGAYDSMTSWPAAPFRVALRDCGEGQVKCMLGDAGIGADPNSAQCCSKSEVCVPGSGCLLSPYAQIPGL